MNYIRHLNQVFLRFNSDDRLNSTHVSLYMALFQEWNQNHFPKKMFINRGEIMKRSKLGSTSTYHRCIRELHTWEYMKYHPSKNPFKGSGIEMICFIERKEATRETNRSTSEQVMQQDNSIESQMAGQKNATVEQVPVHCSPTGEQASISNINNTKHKNISKRKKPESEKEVIDFFESNKWLQVDALKFYYHYQSIGWKKAGDTELTDWKAAAKSWILRGRDFQAVRKPYRDNLKTSKTKYYGPL